VDPWFRKKRIGFGFTPTSWQGWLVTALFVAAVYGASRVMRSWEGPHRTTPFLIVVGCLLGLFTLIAGRRSRSD